MAQQEQQPPQQGASEDSTDSQRNVIDELLELLENNSDVSSVSPGIFRGHKDEDAKRWWQRYKKYVQDAYWPGEKQPKEINLFLTEEAESWYNSQPESVQNDIEALGTVFMNRFGLPHSQMPADEESLKQLKVRSWKPTINGTLKFRRTSTEQEKYVKFYYYRENIDDVRNVFETILNDLSIEERETLQVITISGGDDNILWKKELQEFLIDELKKLIQNDEPTLIITSGVDSGIVNIVGETLRKMPAWTTTNRKACLGILQDDYKMEDQLENDDEKTGLSTVNIMTLLEKNEDDVRLPNRHHTHLLFVKPSDKHHFLIKGKDIRRQLEHYLTKKAHANLGWSVVLLSVGGSLTTIREVADAVSDDKPIPVVLFRGTGGATDLIKYIRKRTNPEDQDLLSRQMCNEFKHLQKCTGCRERIKYYARIICKREKWLRKYKPRWTKTTTKENKIRQQKSLADVIADVTANMKGEGLPLLIQALRNQNITEIRRLLSGGKNISVDLPKGTLSVQGKQLKGGSEEKNEVDEKLLKAIKKYFKKKIDSIEEGRSTESTEQYANQQLNCDIFLWAITTSRFEVADYLWSRLEDPIIASLVVSCALRSVAQKLPQREQKKHDRYTEFSRNYERKAIALIEIAYKRDLEEAGDVLEELHESWRDFNCLDVAIRGKAKDFLSNDCCRFKLRKMWFGEIDIEEKHWKVVILSPVYWLFAPCIPLEIEGQSSCSYFKACRAFYRAPVAKYGCYIATYFVFLLLYAYLMVFNHFDNTFSAIDIILHIWIVTLFIETIREMLYLYTRGRNFTRWKHFKEWLKKFWNQLALTKIISVIVAFTCRWFTVSRQAARFFYAVSYSLFTMEILRLYTASKVLGPLVSMIKLMFITTVKFSAIFVVFLSAYAVAVQAVIGGHAGEKVTFYALLDIFYEPYFQTFGEFFLDDIPGADEEANEDAPRTVTSTMYIVFLAFYIFVGHLLMMNLLIAIFNRDIDKVYEQSKEIWNYEHHILHMQFSKKPVLPEPLSLLVYFYYLGRYLVTCCCGKEQPEQRTKSHKEFVRECMNEYIEMEARSPDRSRGQMISQLKKISDDINERNWKVKTITKEIKLNTNAIEEKVGGEHGLGKKMDAFERNVMQTLVDSIERSKKMEAFERNVMQKLDEAVERSKRNGEAMEELKEIIGSTHSSKRKKMPGKTQ